VHRVSPPEVFQKQREGKSTEQSNRDKRKQLNFFAYSITPKIPALKSMNLFRANTGENDRKLFQVDVFKTTEMKITLFVLWVFSFLPFTNVCFKVPSDLFRNILALPHTIGWTRCCTYSFNQPKLNSSCFFKKKNYLMN